MLDECVYVRIHARTYMRDGQAGRGPGATSRPWYILYTCIHIYVRRSFQLTCLLINYSILKVNIEVHVHAYVRMHARSLSGLKEHFNQARARARSRLQHPKLSPNCKLTIEAVYLAMRWQKLWRYFRAATKRRLAMFYAS